MTDLNLDGAALDMDGTTFTYDLPAPFGPNRGPAVIEITARPAASVNVAYRREIDKIMHKAKVSDLRAQKKYERTGDEDVYVKELDEGAKMVRRTISELTFDHCIIEWKTTVQNSGANLEPTRDNFIALSEFEHPKIQNVMQAMQRDLANWEKFTAEAKSEAEAAEVGNS